MRTKKAIRLFAIVLMISTMFVVYPLTSSNHSYAASKLSSVSGLKVSSTGHSSVKLTWKKVSGAKNYQVYRSNTANGKYRKVMTLSVKKNSFTDKSVYAGKKYYYKVRAINGKRKGSFSKKVSANPRLRMPVVTFTADDSIILKWKKVPGATAYEIFKKSEYDEKFKRIEVLRSDENAYSDYSVTEGVMYEYKVRAVKVYKKTQYFNSTTKKWQNKKPSKGNWKGKKTRKKKVYTSYSKTDVKQTRLISDSDFIEYTDDAIVSELEDETDYSVIDSDSESAIIEASADPTIDNLNKGDIVVFPRNEDATSNGVAMKITDIDNKSNGDVIISGIKPQVSDVVESMNIADADSFDMGVFIPADGVYLESDVISSRSDGDSKSLVVSVNPNKGIEIKFEKAAGAPCRKVTSKPGAMLNPFFDSKDDTSWKMETSISGSIRLKFNPKIKYSYKSGRVENFNATLETQTEYKLEMGGKLEGKVPLGKFSLWMPYGFELENELYLVAGAEGKVEVVVEETLRPGATYTSTKGISYNTSKSNRKVNISGTTKVYTYINVASEFQFVSIPVVGLGFNGGVGCECKVTPHSTVPKQCTDIRIYPILKIGLDYTSGLPKIIDKLNKNIKWELVLLDESNAFSHKHYEDGARTKYDICSYDAVDDCSLDFLNGYFVTENYPMNDENLPKGENAYYLYVWKENGRYKSAYEQMFYFDGHNQLEDVYIYPTDITNAQIDGNLITYTATNIGGEKKKAVIECHKGKTKAEDYIVIRFGEIKNTLYRYS